MTRRDLFKLAALLPFAGPLLAKGLAGSPAKPQIFYPPYLPTHFPTWDKAVDGLEDAGTWALNYEYSRIPANVIIPKAGEVWQATNNCEIPFHASMRPVPMPTQGSPLDLSKLSTAELNLLLGFGTAQLQRGERVRILEVGPKPVTVRFVPLRYQELHEIIVPAKIRCNPGYGGYTLQLKIVKTVSDLCKVGSPSPVFFNEAFTLV